MLRSTRIRKRSQVGNATPASVVADPSSGTVAAAPASLGSVMTDITPPTQTTTTTTAPEPPSGSSSSALDTLLQRVEAQDRLIQALSIRLATTHSVPSIIPMGNSTPDLTILSDTAVGVGGLTTGTPPTGSTSVPPPLQSSPMPVMLGQNVVRLELPINRKKLNLWEDLSLNNAPTNIDLIDPNS